MENELTTGKGMLSAKPQHPNQYSNYIDQLHAQASELEKRLIPILQDVASDDKETTTQPQLLSDLQGVTRRFEVLIKIINI